MIYIIDMLLMMTPNPRLQIILKLYCPNAQLCTVMSTQRGKSQGLQGETLLALMRSQKHLKLRLHIAQNQNRIMIDGRHGKNLYSILLTWIRLLDKEASNSLKSSKISNFSRISEPLGSSRWNLYRS